MRQSLYKLAGAGLAILALGACQPAPDESSDAAIDAAPQVNTSPNDKREYGVLELENGLKVIVVSDPEADKAAAALNVHVGSMQNPDEQLGLAHYLEHMLFLGTEKYPDPDEYGDFMSRHGGTHNAYTADDHTNYMFEIDNERLDEALDRFADFFKSPQFYPDYSEKEVNAVNSEWSMRRASDGFILFKLNNILLNPEHPIARFRIGNNESLGDKEGSVLYDEMKDFYDRYYSANIMTGAVVGNYSVEELKEKARAAFADIPDRDVTVPAIDEPAVTDAERNLQIFYKPQMEMRLLQLDFTIDNNRDEFAKKPNALIAYLINSEMPGTPAAYFREQEWIESLNAGAQPAAYGNAGRFIIQVNLTESGMQNREVIAGVLFDYIESIREQGIDEAYVDELRQVLDNQFEYLERQNAFNYASSLASSLQYLPVANVIDAPFRLDEHDSEAINEVLNQLRPDNARVWFISPQEEVDQSLHYFDGEYRVEPLSEEIIAEWRAQADGIEVTLPSVNNWMPESLAVHPIEGADAPRQVVERDGVSAWLKRSERFQEPRANVTLNFYQPGFERDINESMAAQVLSQAFSSSTQALAREASIAGVNFSLSVGNGLTLSLTGFDDKQEALATRVLSEFAAYEPSNTRLEQIKDRLRRNIENQRRQFPVQQLSPRFSSIMNPPSANLEAELEALAAVDMSAVIAMRDRLLEQTRLRTLVVGNYTADEVESLVAKVTGIISVDSDVHYQRSPVLEPRAGEAVQWQEDVVLEDSAILDAFVMEDENIVTRAKASLAAELLHNRFFNQLRTEQQLGYAVGATALGVRDHGVLAFYIQSSVAGPAELQGHFQRFREDSESYLEDMDDATFAEAKQGLLVSLNEPPQDLAQEASRIRADWARENYNFDTRSNLSEAVDRLQKGDMLEFYRNQVLGDGSMRVLIELRGSKFSEADWAELDDAVIIEDLREFQQEW
ncbi:pitrilysin [Aliidiomarina sp. Khilg15.8]